MKINFTKTAAFILAFCLGAVPLTGCGDKELAQEKNEPSLGQVDEPKAGIEAATAAVTTTEIITATEPETVAREDVNYELRDEMTSVGLASGIVQIGNDIFKNGGYYTVDQFVAEYGDRYDMSEIDPEGACSGTSSRALITSKQDEDITIEVIYSGKADDELIRKGDAIVYSIIPSSVDNVWYAHGIESNLKAKGLGYDDAKNYYNGFGFTEGTHEENICGVYDKLTVQVLGDDENLFGFKPVYTYAFSYTDEKVSKFRLLDVHAVMSANETYHNN